MAVSALAGVAQWIGHQPVNLRVPRSLLAGLMPGLLAMYPVGDEQEEVNGCFFPSFSPSLLLSLKINK